MAANSTSVVEVGLPPEQAEAALYQAFLAIGLKDAHGGAGVLQGNVGASLMSWGEKITATIAHGPHGATVHLRSECALPTVLFDFGRNAKNLRKLTEALRGLAPVL